MTRSKVKVKVMNDWKSVKRSQPSVPYKTNFVVVDTQGYITQLTAVVANFCNKTSSFFKWMSFVSCVFQTSLWGDLVNCWLATLWRVCQPACVSRSSSVVDRVIVFGSVFWTTASARPPSCFVSHGNVVTFHTYIINFGCFVSIYLAKKRESVSQSHWMMR